MSDLLSAPVALVEPTHESHAPTVLSPADLASAYSSATRSEGGVLELLWQQREVELTGLLHRVRVPVIGRNIAGGLAAELTALLAAWWVDRQALSPTVTVTSVVADLQGSPGLGYELVILVTTDALADDHSIVGVRMVRDLRRALRIGRLSAATFASPLAA